MKSIWLKITGALSIVIAFLLTILKLKASKIDRLERENKMLEKEQEITEHMQEVEITQAQREEKAINDKAQKARDNWADIIND